MDRDLCLEPLLAEFFNPCRFGGLSALLEVCQVNSKFSDYFQRREKPIYLRLIQARLELDAESLSLAELRQFLLRVPELFLEKDVPLTMVALSDTPKLFLLALPRLQSKFCFDLLACAQQHDSSQTYAAVIKSYPDFFQQKIDRIYVAILCRHLLQSKAVACAGELFLGIPSRFYSPALSTLQSGGSRFILPVLVKYRQVTGKTLDDLLTHTPVESILPFFREEELDDRLKLIRWVLTQTIDEGFRRNPCWFLVTASISPETLQQLREKFPQQLAVRECLQELRQFNCSRLCSLEDFHESLRRMSDAGLLFPEEVNEIAGVFQDSP